VKEVETGDTEKELCLKCGKRIAQNKRPGSLTSYLFSHPDCACQRAGDQAKIVQSSSKGQRDGESDFCPKCGLRTATDSSSGSLTGFLFQSTRCKCPGDPAFADGAMSAKFWKLKETGGGTIFTTATDTPSRATSSSIDLLSGAIIGGAYRIIKLLGRGGMGEVYLAKHETLGKKCALKVIPPEQVTEIGWQRFQLEAKAVAKLDHINLVRVTDLGIHEGCLPFYAMDFVDGQNLADLLVEQGPIPLKMTLEIFKQVCDGVECAHHHGILHRDLKPANIMLLPTQGGVKQAKVLDFGLAKLTGHDRNKQSLTAVGDVFGSPFYMSPEQCNGEKLDNRSDIYSLGCTMFECLTGQPPFSGHRASAVIFSHLEADAPSLESVAGPGKFSTSMEVVMAKLLRKNPVERYQTLSELRLDLEKVARGEDVQPFYVSRSKPAQDRAGASEAAISGKALAAEPAESRFRLGGAMVVSITFITLMGLGAIGYIVSKRPSAAPTFPLLDNSLFKQQEQKPKPTIASAKLATVTDTAPFTLTIKIGPQGRTKSFLFPPGKHGAIIRTETAVDGLACSGQCNFPADAHLILQCYEGVSPEFIRRFRPNDLYGLELKQRLDSEWTASHMEAISRLNGLKSLDISDSEIEGPVLPSINKLVNLTILRISRTKIRGEELLTLCMLPRLEVVMASGTVHIRAFLKGIRKPYVLHRLWLSDDGLTDEDMLLISKIVSLQDILLDSNSITVEGLKSLSTLPNLEVLSVASMKFTPQCIETMSHFRHLHRLRMSVMEWPSLDQLRLKKALPKDCIIEDRRQLD
jgi:serine/threonine protein kinase